MVTTDKIVRLDFCEIIFHKAGFVELIFDDDTFIEVSNGHQVVEILNSYLGDEKVPILQVLGKHMHFSKEAREFAITKRGHKNVLINAYVLDSLPHKILANFYIKFNKPPFPTKIFSTRKEALDWLLTFVK